MNPIASTKAMEGAVAAYYDAIEKQDFEKAYALWTPAMQKGLTPNDLANQWLSLGANGAQVTLRVSMSEPPGGDFVPATVTETESYPSGYVRKKVLEGGWHVVNISGRWLLNERDFKTVADNGPPPTVPFNEDKRRGSGASISSDAVEGATQSITPAIARSRGIGQRTKFTVGDMDGGPVSVLASPEAICDESLEMAWLHEKVAAGEIDGNMAMRTFWSLPGHTKVRGGSSIEKTGAAKTVSCPADAYAVPLDMVPVLVTDGPQKGTIGFVVSSYIRDR